MDLVSAWLDLMSSFRSFRFVFILSWVALISLVFAFVLGPVAARSYKLVGVLLQKNF
jgi:hypothetical protein